MFAAIRRSGKTVVSHKHSLGVLGLLSLVCGVAGSYCSARSCSDIDTIMEAKWEQALKALPDPTTSGKLPAFYLAHGSPLLVWPKSTPIGGPFKNLAKIGGPNGQHAAFLKYFGKFILKNYKPKALVVFSAHWETQGEIHVTGYENNHLLYDYYGFPDEMYDIKFESKGSPEIAGQVAELLKKGGMRSRVLPSGRGLDHGVFVPFTLMFPDPCPVPIIEVSMDSLDPERLIRIGKALEPLRSEGVLILSGGLSIHTFEDFNAWNPDTAAEGYKDFHKTIVDSVDKNKDNTEARHKQMLALTSHPYFRRAHPREEHFVPLYVAAGAGSSGSASVVCDLFGAVTIAFGA
eukprot:Colp12_sorted_trinity150504_noHs@3337